MARLTLEDVGRLAGVSRSTVSRVINDASAVSPAVRDRVRGVIDETGYGPNRAARSLASNRSDVLGLIIPSAVHHVFEDPYFGRLVRGITRAANAAGQMLALFLFEDPRDEGAIDGRVIGSGLVDGVIVTATQMSGELPDRLRDGRVTFVTVGRPDREDAVHVDVDNRGGAAAATRHLLDHGATRVATVAGPATSTTGVDRLAGYADALASAGREVDTSLVAEADFSRSGGREAAAALLADRRPDAIFCASDSMALGALDAIAAAGRRCPEDVAVVGFDGLVGPQDATPALTTVRQPVVETGVRAVELLLDAIAGRSPATPRVELPTELVLRRSCGCDP